MALAPTAGAAPVAEFSDIASITRESDCNGCPTGLLLLLRRDGTATLTETGKARFGTEDKASRASISAVQFDALAQLVARQRFFEMDDVYQSAETRDGPWTTVTVARSGRSKSVFARDGAAPAALKSIEAAIDAWQSSVAFTPAQRPPPGR